jgi:hypothetical protein
MSKKTTITTATTEVKHAIHAVEQKLFAKVEVAD